MKVLALAVLIIAISGLEAGVVKREVSGTPDIASIFQNWFDTLKAQTQEFHEKFNNGEIQAQAGQLLESTKAQAQPIKEQLESLVAKLVDAAKQWQ